MSYDMNYLNNIPGMLAHLQGGNAIYFDPIQYQGQEVELSIYPVTIGHEKIGEYHVALTSLSDGRPQAERIVKEITVRPQLSKPLELLAVEAAREIIKG